MGAIKLTKIGNSQGFTIPKEILEKGDFAIGDFLEAHFHNGRLILFKKPLHHSKMKFEGQQNKEDLEWADANLDEWDVKK